MPTDLPPAALRLEVDRAALAANWRLLDALSGRASAGAAVKADAYGVGARVAVPVLREAGCRDFFVTYAAEAADILDLAPPGDIAMLHGLLGAADAAFCRETGVRPVINSLRQARLWLDSGVGACDLMVDTGINRLGLSMDELGDETVARLEVGLLMSHLASADEDSAFNATQLARWQQACATIPHARASLANSAGILLGEAYHGAVTRPGLALYGGVPRRELAGRIRQVARPMAAIMQVRNLVAGETVGYNATWTAPGPVRVGAVALGYADGYLRCWSGKGGMLHAGRRLPVLGRVSMDMTVIDLSAAPDLDEGDWVEAEYSLPEAAALSGLSQYELITLLADRFAR
ncbi:MAG TPA: alanine racemase [Novosphingobium sp.]|nr:alanine racemase [Novosphingobium sp.]